MNKKAKKMLQKSTAVFTAALLSISAVPAHVLAADSYSSTEKEAWKKTTADFAKAYAASLEEYKTLIPGSHCDMVLKLDDSGRSLLGFMVPYDMSWFDNVKLSVDATMENSSQASTMGLYLNDSLVCTMEYYLDADTQDIYMKIPELSDAYLKMNMKDVMEAQAAAAEEMAEEGMDDSEAFTEAYSNSMEISMAIAGDLEKYLPGADAAETILNRYGNLLFDNMTDVEGTADTMNTEGVSVDCTLYEGQITSENAQALLNQILDTAKSDKELEDLLKNWEANIPDCENLYQKFQDGIEDLASELSEVDESEDDSYISSKIWVDENDEIVGRQISLFEDGADVPLITWKMPKKDGNFGYVFQIDADGSSVALTGKGTIADGMLNGNYQFELDYTPYASIEVANYDTESAKNGYINGDYTLSFIASDSEDESMAMLANFQLILNMADQPLDSTVNLAITSAGSTLGSLNITGKQGDKVETPDLASLEKVYDITNEEDMTAYASELTLDTIFTNLTGAGMPQELLDALLSGGEEDVEVLEDYAEEEPAA